MSPPNQSPLSAPSRLKAAQREDKKPAEGNLARVSVMSRLRIVNYSIRSSGENGASSTFSMLKRSVDTMFLIASYQYSTGATGHFRLRDAAKPACQASGDSIQARFHTSAKY